MATKTLADVVGNLEAKGETQFTGNQRFFQQVRPRVNKTNRLAKVVGDLAQTTSQAVTKIQTANEREMVNAVDMMATEYNRNLSGVDIDTITSEARKGGAKVSHQQAFEDKFSDMDEKVDGFLDSLAPDDKKKYQAQFLKSTMARAGKLVQYAQQKDFYEEKKTTTNSLMSSLRDSDINSIKMRLDNSTVAVNQYQIEPEKLNSAVDEGVFNNISHREEFHSLSLKDANSQALSYMKKIYGNNLDVNQTARAKVIAQKFVNARAGGSITDTKAKTLIGNLQLTAFNAGGAGKKYTSRDEAIASLEAGGVDRRKFDPNSEYYNGALSVALEKVINSNSDATAVARDISDKTIPATEKQYKIAIATETNNLQEKNAGKPVTDAMIIDGIASNGKLINLGMSRLIGAIDSGDNNLASQYSVAMSAYLKETDIDSLKTSLGLNPNQAREVSVHIGYAKIGYSPQSTQLINAKIFQKLASETSSSDDKKEWNKMRKGWIGEVAGNRMFTTSTMPKSQLVDSYIALRSSDMSEEDAKTLITKWHEKHAVSIPVADSKLTYARLKSPVKYFLGLNAGEVTKRKDSPLDEDGVPIIGSNALVSDIVTSKEEQTVMMNAIHDIAIISAKVEEGSTVIMVDMDSTENKLIKDNAPNGTMAVKVRDKFGQWKVAYPRIEDAMIKVVEYKKEVEKASKQRVRSRRG